MRLNLILACLTMALVLGVRPAIGQHGFEEEDGYRSLFNGDDLTGWKIPEGDNGHWKVVNGVIDYDARSEAKGDRNLKTVDDFGNFILKIEWRIKELNGAYDTPIVLSDGSYLNDANGKKITIRRPGADSGVFLRGFSKAQLNIWRWPVGSGEVYGIRNNPETPAAIRAGVTPKINADRPVGQWNEFLVVLIGDEVTVLLNDRLVLEKAKLPGIPDRGPIVLQHHGGPTKSGELHGASSMVQFRNIWIKPLD